MNLCVKLYPKILEKEFLTKCTASEYPPNIKIPFSSIVTIFLAIFSQPWSFWAAPLGFSLKATVYKGVRTWGNPLDMAHTHCSTQISHHNLTNFTTESTLYIQRSVPKLINSKQQGLFTPEVTMTQQINNQQLQLLQNWQGWKFLITFQEISLVLQIVQDLTTAVSQATFWTAYSCSIFSVFQEENKLYLAQSAPYLYNRHTASIGLFPDLFHFFSSSYL